MRIVFFCFRIINYLKTIFFFQIWFFINTISLKLHCPVNLLERIENMLWCSPETDELSMLNIINYDFIKYDHREAFTQIQGRHMTIWTQTFSSHFNSSL